MRIFVTGASGFIGGHLVEHLARHHDVLGMARSDAAAAAVRRFGGTPVASALGEVTPAALAGVDVIVHAAAHLQGVDRAAYWRVNVDGTSQLLDAARAAGVGRVIFIGTEAALFDGHDLRDIDERHPYPRRHRFLYSATKAEAERRVLGASDDRLTALSIRPRLVWGPRDASVLPALAAMVEAGKFRWIDGGLQETSTTHVDNLVAAVERALSQGRGGQAYFVADAERSTLREFLTRLLATRGVVAPDRGAPGALLRPLARAVEAVWRLLRLRTEPPLSAFAVAMMSRTVTVRTEKARAELGWSPVITVDRGLAQMATLS